MTDGVIPSPLAPENGALQVGLSWFVVERAARTVLRTFMEIYP